MSDGRIVELGEVDEVLDRRGGVHAGSCSPTRRASSKHSPRAS